MKHLSRSPSLRPMLASEFWLIGSAPDIPELCSPYLLDRPEFVDHHLFRGPDGTCHLWGCIRGTVTGRILYHWEGERLNEGPWRPTGEILRPDQSAGESIADWEDREWIQSPFVVKSDNLFYFFYGGHSTGFDHFGSGVPPGDPRVECQICLMTSADGRTWERRLDEHGQSRVFVGPGEARDPCVIRIGDTWHMYYAGYESGDPLRPGIYLRTSSDLIHWSDPCLVHRDYRFGIGRWTHECPQVVQRGEHFYLFRTEDYNHARTHVYGSKDPNDFGVDHATGEKYIGLLPLAAPEVIVDDDGCDYITSCHDLHKGIQICRLAWVND